ncbi:MAG: AMP-binding protein [Clostridiales bacterium]|jgi:acetyl-CoA synthetase|nr:AMP-binding protein [Bacillota bacterium]NLH59639.1 AMP-binding protein [Clostridiales bacterium]
MLNLLKKTDFNSYEEFIEKFEINVPENFNFAFDVVDKIADQSPDKLALLWCDENNNEKCFTFKQIKDLSNQAANLFIAMGVKKGDHVMLILKRRYEFWYCLMALHKIGAIAIPATHMLTPKDIAYRVNAASIKMVICVNDREVISHIEEAEKTTGPLELKCLVGGKRDGWYSFDDRIYSHNESFPRPSGEKATKNDDTLLLYFTSGTTGHPKMVQHTYTYPLGHIVTAMYWQNVKDGGLHLTVADTGWAKSVWGKLYGQWIAGCTVFVYDYDRFVPKDLLKVIAKYKVTSFCAPPTIYRYLIKEDMRAYDLSQLEYCVVAGEPLNPEVYNQFYKLTGIKLMEAYGQTELTVVIGTFPWMKPKPGSMGKPSAGYEVDLVDEDGNSLDIGQEGQIVIKTHKHKPLGMFKGYYRDEAMTERVWNNDIYYTGDMAWKDEDGYFWFVGRVDDVIKSSGYRIGPFEVESALMEHPAVLECAITAVSDEIRGQVVKATIVLAQGYTPCDQLAKDLQDHVKKVTAPYKYPRIVEFVTELPKTISGKIRRVEIREQD